MIISEAEQGSIEWGNDRAGVLSASSFAKVLSPTGKLSTQAEVYMRTLAGEKITGKKEDGYCGGHMQNGIDTEAEACDFFQLITGKKIEKVGFCFKDEEKNIGCSPDGLEFIDGIANEGLEIKCPKLSTHVEYLLAGEVPDKYIPQIQGSMFVTGLEKWNFFSYFPDMPPVHLVIERDEIWIAKFGKAIKEFNVELEEVYQQLLKKGA